MTIMQRRPIQLTVNKINARRSAVALEKRSPNPTGRTETVEEFVARGGVIQKLSQGDTSRPLRFLDEPFIDLD